MITRVPRRRPKGKGGKELEGGRERVMAVLSLVCSTFEVRFLLLATRVAIRTPALRACYQPGKDQSTHHDRR